jgi:hypothetical protein
VPDALFTSARGVQTALEVELTVKAGERVRDIVRDLTLDHEAVLYVVADQRVGAVVESAVRAVGEERRVSIVGLDRFTAERSA